MARTRIAVTVATVLYASVAAAQSASQPQPPPPPPTDINPPAPPPAPPPPPPAMPLPPAPPAEAAPPASSTPAASTPAPSAPAPADPYGADPVLAEQIAEQLVTRAQELFEAKIYVDAKQLAVEALVKSPKGNAAERARYIIKLVNVALNIKDDPAPIPPSEVKPAAIEEQVDLSPISEPAPTTEPAPLVDVEHDPRIAGMVHGGLTLGTIGAMIGAYIGQDHPTAVAVPAGLAAAAGGALLGRYAVGKLAWDEAQVRTAGSASVWAGVIGGLMTDAITGAGDGPASGKAILLGASIGSTLGLVGGGAFAQKRTLTRGDVALVDTLAGIGAAGGLTIGMLMQPAQKEAYAVNSMIGAAGGLVVGMIAAPNTNTTPRRMLRVAGLSAAGGAAPFLLYAAIYDKGTGSDEQVVGFLSSAGLVAGAYLGFRLTRGMDEGLDVTSKRADDAPAAAIGRNSDGSWAVGGVGMQPLSSKLSTGTSGMTFTLLGGAF